MSISQMIKVWEHEFSHPKQSVMLALADHAHDDGTEVRPSFKRIAWKTGYSHRNVRRIIKELKADNVLRVQKEATNKEPAVFYFDWSSATKKESFEAYLSRENDNLSPQPRGDKSGTLRGQVGHLEGTSQASRGDKSDTLRGPGCPPNHPVTINKTKENPQTNKEAPTSFGEESPSAGSAAGSPSASPPGEEGRSKNSGTTPLPPSTRKSAPSFADHAESGRSFKSSSARMDDYYSGKTKPRKSAKWLDGDRFFQPFVDYLAKRYTKAPETERRSKAVSALQWAMSNRPDAAPAKAAMNEHWNCFKAQYDAEKNAPALPTDGFEFSSELARSNNFWNTQDGKALLDKLRPYISEVVIGSYTFPLRQVNLDRNAVPYIAKIEQGQWRIRRKHPVIKEVA